MSNISSEKIKADLQNLLKKHITNTIGQVDSNKLIQGEMATSISSIIVGAMNDAPTRQSEHIAGTTEKSVVVGGDGMNGHYKIQFMRIDNKAMLQSAPLVNRYDIRQVETPGIADSITRFSANGANGIDSNIYPRYIYSLSVIESGIASFIGDLSNRGILTNDQVLTLIMRGDIIFRYGGLIISPKLYKKGTKIESIEQLKTMIRNGDISVYIKYLIDETLSQCTKDDGKWGTVGTTSDSNIQF